MHWKHWDTFWMNVKSMCYSFSYGLVANGDQTIIYSEIDKNSRRQDSVRRYTGPGTWCAETYFWPRVGNISGIRELSHWGLKRNSWHFPDNNLKNILEWTSLYFTFHWCLLWRAHFKIIQHWFRRWHDTEQKPSHYRTNHNLDRWCRMASLATMS